MLINGLCTEAADEREGNKDMSETDAIVTKVKKNFSRNHAMSIHINLIAVVATVGYVFVLGGRLQLQ